MEWELDNPKNGLPLMEESLVYWIALQTSSKGVRDVDSLTFNFPLSIKVIEIILIDVVCEAGGGLDNGKTPMSDESLISPTPMS